MNIEYAMAEKKMRAPELAVASLFLSSLVRAYGVDLTLNSNKGSSVATFRMDSYMN